jgi:hypothetical protein
MSINLKKLLDTFEKEDIILDTVNKMSPRERQMVSLAFGLIVDTISDDKISIERREILTSEISLLSKMSDKEWEEKH